jgi:hypothetical protein
MLVNPFVAVGSSSGEEGCWVREVSPHASETRVDLESRLALTVHTRYFRRCHCFHLDPVVVGP